MTPQPTKTTPPITTDYMGADGEVRTVLPPAVDYRSIGNNTIITWEAGKYHAVVQTTEHGGIVLSQHAHAQQAHDAAALEKYYGCDCGCAGVIRRSDAD